MRVLALDLGQKRIGIAVGDTSSRVATPIKTLDRSGSLIEDHQLIAGIVEEWSVKILVVGMPYSLDGSKGPASHLVSDEVDKLSKTLAVPIEIYDERFTTVSADKSLIEQGLSSRRRRSKVDQLAAAIILQAWLDNRDKVSNE